MFCNQMREANMCTNIITNRLAAIVQHQAVKSEKSQSNEQDGGSTSARSSSRRKEADRRRGMALPFEPHSITFDDVTYSVDMPQVM